MFYFRDLRDSLRPFARLHSPDEHEIFVQGLLSKLTKKIRSVKYYLDINRNTMLMLQLVFFQWKIFLRKKLSVYKNTDQQEFALEKVHVCRILKIKYNIHLPYQMSKICIKNNISAKDKMTCLGNVSYVQDGFHFRSHFNSPVLVISMQSLQNAI